LGGLKGDSRKIHKIDFDILEGTEVVEAVKSSSLGYVHFDQEHLQWTKDAGTLLNQCVTAFQLEPPIY